MRTDRAVTRMTGDQVVMRLIVDRQTPVKTLPSLAVGKNVNVIKTLNACLPALLIPQNNMGKKTTGFVTNISVSTSKLPDKNNNVMTSV